MKSFKQFGLLQAVPLALVLAALYFADFPWLGQSVKKLFAVLGF